MVAGLPPKITVDLLLRREGKAAVHVLIVDRNLAPGPREQVPERLWAHGAAFRPVFLRGRLRQPENDPERFLLDPPGAALGRSDPR